MKNSMRNSMRYSMTSKKKSIKLASRVLFPNVALSLSFIAQRVGFFNIRSGRVLDKIPGSGSGRSVEIYDQVFLGIFFIFGYFWR